MQLVYCAGYKFDLIFFNVITDVMILIKYAEYRHDAMGVGVDSKVNCSNQN